jgi:hypothetical protein
MGEFLTLIFMLGTDDGKVILSERFMPGFDERRKEMAAWCKGKRKREEEQLADLADDEE